jgi:hypothetical protein
MKEHEISFMKEPPKVVSYEGMSGQTIGDKS